MIQKFKSKIKNTYLTLLGRSLFPTKSININAKWLGNNYGGFYIYPNKLNAESIVYSFGIGEDISFDLALIAKYGCSVYGFDPTPKSIEWVDKTVDEKRFIFQPYGISTNSGTEAFFLPKNIEYVSGSLHNIETVNILDRIEVPMKNFKDITQELKHTWVDILKMDIEGAEYEVLHNILSNKNVSIMQICVEFHHRMFKNGGRKTQEAIDLLANNGYVLFAFSDSCEELSFINTKFI